MGMLSNAQGQITPQYVVELCRISNSFETVIMVVLLTCKNEEDIIKDGGARVLTNF